MESRAVTRWVHLSPPKARLVVNLIRGKRVDLAIEILDNTPRRASGIVKKTLESAVANMLSREGSAHVKTENLFVKTAFVDVGPQLKRFLPRAMGRATKVRKRLAHITIIIGEVEGKKHAAPPARAPAAAKREPKTKAKAKKSD